MKLVDKIIWDFHASLFSAGGPFSEFWVNLLLVKDAITKNEVCQKLIKIFQIWKKVLDPEFNSEIIYTLCILILWAKNGISDEKRVNLTLYFTVLER